MFLNLTEEPADSRPQLERKINFLYLLDELGHERRPSQW